MADSDRFAGTTRSPPSTTLLRLSAGTVYFYFGFLKFFPDLSPAELLAGQSIMKISFHLVDAHTALWWLAVLECAIGLCFLFNVCMRWLLYVFLAHQASTFLPLFIFPEICFKIAPFAPTMEGQYILKNLISVAAGWTVLLPAAMEQVHQLSARSSDETRTHTCSGTSDEEMETECEPASLTASIQA